MKTASFMKTTLLLLAATLSLPAQAANVVVEYIHTDHLGTPIAVTDESGNVIERFEYEPYGLQVSGPVEDGPGYTGHVEDAVTGLTYMQQRYYDPGIGMFLSVDPVTAYSSPVGQFNRYRYANGNPYKYMDPDGRYTCEGTKQDCAQVDAYVDKIREAGRARNLKADEREKIRAISSYLGEKGEGGPKITPTALPKNTRARTDQQGNIKIDINKNSPGIEPVVSGAMALGHEAQHDIDAKENGATHTREGATERERNAYRVEAIIGKANGIRLSPTAIDAAVQGSVINAFGPEPEVKDENP